jgi:rhodanese-related sulfurtransferase
MNPMRLGKSYEDLNSNEFQKKMTGNANAVLLDVRTPAEFGESRIPKAINIDIMDSSFVQKISALDKTKTYFLYCRGGSRSGQACGLMAANGFKVYNLAGGITNWKGEVN